MIYSQMSKLLAPVMASMPFKRLKLDFTGELSERKMESALFVTHGGLPMINIPDGSRIKDFKENEKKSALIIFTLLSWIVFSQIAQYSGLISIP